MNTYNDNRPFEIISHECLHCGFYCYPQTGYRSLEELNDSREDNEMEPLKELPKQEEIY